MKEQLEIESVLPDRNKNGLREFIQGQNVLVNLPTGFPASSNSCRCTAAHSSISPTLGRVKTNLEIVIFTDKNKLHICSYSGSDNSHKTKETNKYKVIYGKENLLSVNCITKYCPRKSVET